MYMLLQHGRVKVRSSEEQERARKKERDDKASAYKTIMARIFNKVGVANKVGVVSAHVCVCGSL